VGKLNELKKRLSNFNPNDTLNLVLDTSSTDKFITDMGKDRLNTKGEDSTGKKLKTKRAKRGVYANYTIFEKMRKGQPYKIVTLKDSGDFQKSFELNLQKEMFNVKGDSDKPDGRIEDNIDFKNILNLSDEEKTKLVHEIKPKYIKEIRSIIKV
jgi:tRNA U34 5-carboxymethylaminomethyl modifying enzyme MnmG/GidA